jgi:hypothetical protein
LDAKLRSIVLANGLQAFYDEQALQSVLRRVCAVDFARLAADWAISAELARDLCSLALYDVVFFCDDSGSMAFEDGGERIQDLKYILGKVASVVGAFDEDGMSVRFINSPAKADGVRDEAGALQALAGVGFNGGTALGTQLRAKVIEPMVLGRCKGFLGRVQSAIGMSGGLAKPVLAFVITDGEPAGEHRGTLQQVLRDTRAALAGTKYGPKALAVQVAQVGKDARAQRFLAELDNDPTVGDVVDCTSYYELEADEFQRKNPGVVLTPELWLLKMCLGAIDPEYDGMD